MIILRSMIDFKINAIDVGTGQLTVDRSQFSTPLRLHASSNNVSLHIQMMILIIDCLLGDLSLVLVLLV